MNVRLLRGDETDRCIHGASIEIDKPISDFSPGFARRELRPEVFSPLERELILQFRHIEDERLQEAVVKQVKALADLYKSK